MTYYNKTDRVFSVFFSTWIQKQAKRQRTPSSQLAISRNLVADIPGRLVYCNNFLLM